MSFVLSNGEVGYSESTAIFYDEAVIGSRCLYFPYFSVREQSEMHSLTIFTTLAQPLLSAFKPRYSDKSRSVGFCHSTVSSILRWAAWAKIIFSVIQSIAICVVNKIVLVVKNVTVHPDLAEFAIADRFFGHRIVSSIFALLYAPIELHQSFVVLRIYESVVAFCQWDNAIRWIKRLFDSVTLHVVDTSHKEPSFLVRLSAAPLYFTAIRLRLSHLLTQVAHGITSIVQRFAALNNYTRLEAL